MFFFFRATFLSSLIFQFLMLNDTGSRMWKVRCILKVVNIVVNPECISIDPPKGRCTLNRMNKEIGDCVDVMGRVMYDVCIFLEHQFLDIRLLACDCFELNLVLFTL